MEDISRELEKEIMARTRHVPVRRKIRSGFFFIDDFGEIRPAGWVKGFAWFFALTAIVSAAAAFLFYYLYTENRAEKIQLIGNIAEAEKKISSLTNEKEILMARIVISGKPLPRDLTKKIEGLKKSVSAVKTNMAKNKKAGSEQGANSGKNLDENRIVHAFKGNKAGLKPTPDKEKAGVVKKKSDLDRKDIKIEKALEHDLVKQGSKIELLHNGKTKYEKIGIENFKILKDSTTGELLVRFNIKNVSDSSQNISGRIFVILKPDANPLNWLVVPSVPIREGKPVNPKRGQYFSIAHFKAVNFRIKDNSAPDSFKKAAVFIYDKDELICMKEINISQKHGR